MGKCYKFSCDRMWAVRAPQSSPESWRRVLEYWLILHGAKGIQESVNVLCLFFVLPNSYLSSVGKNWAVWPRLMIPVSTGNATGTYMCELLLSLLLRNTLPEQSLGPSLTFQPLSAGSRSTSHLPSLHGSSRLAGACGRWTASSSSPHRSCAS